jgi:hypothetical protein
MIINKIVILKIIFIIVAICLCISGTLFFALNAAYKEKRSYLVFLCEKVSDFKNMMNKEIAIDHKKINNFLSELEICKRYEEFRLAVVLATFGIENNTTLIDSLNLTEKSLNFYIYITDYEHSSLESLLKNILKICFCIFLIIGTILFFAVFLRPKNAVVEHTRQEKEEKG